MGRNVFYGGRKLRLARLQAGIATQKELAECARISPSIISDLERGRREMNATWAMRIAEVVGTPWEALLEEGKEGKV